MDDYSTTRSRRNLERLAKIQAVVEQDELDMIAKEKKAIQKAKEKAERLKHGGNRKGAGRPFNEDPTYRMSFYYFEHDKDNLAKRAENEGLSVGELVRNIVMMNQKRYFARRGGS